MTHSALIVTHGSPSDAETQENALAALAAQVAGLLPGWDIRSATLAAPGRLEAVLDQMDRPLVYPYFMAQGYFTGRVLPKRLEAYGLAPMGPFGVDPALLDVVEERLLEELSAQGWRASATALVVAAHGSAVSKRSANAANDFAKGLQERFDFREIRTGFVEEEPFLEPIATGAGQAMCLPFFALVAGHMIDDVPEALEAAEFAGPVLPSFIDWPQTATIIADALRLQAQHDPGENG
ncbi:MAG: CbiX/SirB N-terminal domain-containing protein [Pelagimonas sp.]|uniref:CbiX/SirB N-terminal domain-containing protein n=1 Tax=Pelagimonas sp. TaxID=2073170 RepID=UPI003D6AD4A9